VASSAPNPNHLASTGAPVTLVRKFWPREALLEDPGLKNKWFDHWLQGADNGVENAPPVSLYPIGGDGWEHHPAWPVPGVSYTPAYLDGGRRSASRPPPRVTATARRSCPPRAPARA